MSEQQGNRRGRKSPSPMRGHRCGIRSPHRTRSFFLYTVYDNRTDEPVIIDGEARQCAEVMKLKLPSFYCAVTRARNMSIKRWTILTWYIDDDTGFDDDDDGGDWPF